MRLSVESSVFTDPRFKLLAKKLGMGKFEVVGRCTAVWLCCYERRDHRLSADMIDAAAEHEGFADALVTCELATQSGKQDGATVSLRGARERIAFLLSQQERGRKGGQSRALKAQANAKQTLEQALEQSPSVASSEGLSNDPSHAQAYSSSSSSSLASTKSLALAAPPEKKRAKPKATASPIPEGWQANQTHARLASELSLSLEEQTAKFRDHHAAKGTNFADWDAAFRTWLRRSKEFAANNSHGSTPPRSSEAPRRIEHL